MNAKLLAGNACRVCDSPALREFENFRALCRVTSDSRPWPAGGRLTLCEECGGVQKLIERDWLDEIDRIYSTYAIYHQGGGKEQPIFGGGAVPPVPRSSALADYVERRVELPAGAQILDFGCGTGAALKTYSARYPNWTLYGSELNSQGLALLQQIPGFVKLFTCPPADIPMRFDLITAFHALEHVLEPVATLCGLSDRLVDGGALFVQVPDGAKNPYDLVIADHLLHFSLDILRYAAQRAGCNVAEVTDAVLPKELSLLVHSGRIASAPRARPRNPRRSGEEIEAQINWLASQPGSAAKIARASRHFGLFGTSISATWLAGQIEDQVAFFVDEDTGRIGGRHMGKPILSPADVAADADVYIPLIPNVAATVAYRLARSGIRFHTPPPLSERTAKHLLVS